MSLISDYLLPGEHLAISARDLCRVAGYENDRSLRSAIDHERLEGVLILSSERGYFLPALNEVDAEREIRRYLARQDARFISNRRTTKYARRKLHEIERSRAGQQQLGGL